MGLNYKTKRTKAMDLLASVLDQAEPQTETHAGTQNLPVKAMQGFDTSPLVKSIRALRKSLIDAERQARLAVDELEEAQYTNATAATERQSVCVDEAIETVRTLSDMVSKATQLSDKAKRSLMSVMNDSDSIFVEPEEAPVQSQRRQTRNYYGSRLRQRPSRLRR